MAIFRRRRRGRQDDEVDPDEGAAADGAGADPDSAGNVPAGSGANRGGANRGDTASDEDEAAGEGDGGPFDESEAPDDGVARLDLGSVRLPVPDGAQLQVEMDPAGPVRAVHVVTSVGQVTVSAYAAPRSGGLWSEVRSELAEQLNSDGARVVSRNGEWGAELSAAVNDVALRFVGVDGPRWMLRGVVAGPPAEENGAVELLREIVRGTVVVRGQDPMPVRTPLPIELPQAIAEHVEQAKASE